MKDEEHALVHISLTSLGLICFMAKNSKSGKLQLSKEERLAENLRANLRRRKQAARKLKSDAASKTES